MVTSLRIFDSVRVIICAKHNHPSKWQAEFIDIPRILSGQLPANILLVLPKLTLLGPPSYGLLLGPQ